MQVSQAVITAAAGVEPSDPPNANSSTVHSCSPNYTDENKLGRLSVQQGGPGASIQWGTYPNLDADKYSVNIYIGSKRIDAKNQTYPPHGSFPARKKDQQGKMVPTYRSGQIFKITGTSYDAKGHIVQKFFIKCRLV